MSKMVFKAASTQNLWARNIRPPRSIYYDFPFHWYFDKLSFGICTPRYKRDVGVGYHIACNLVEFKFIILNVWITNAKFVKFFFNKMPNCYIRFFRGPFDERMSFSRMSYKIKF